MAGTPLDSSLQATEDRSERFKRRSAHSNQKASSSNSAQTPGTFWIPSVRQRVAPNPLKPATQTVIIIEIALIG